MYDAKDAEFAIRVMKSSIVRAQTCIDYLDKAGKAFAYLESWQNSCASMFAIGMVYPAPIQQHECSGERVNEDEETALIKGAETADALSRPRGGKGPK